VIWAVPVMERIRRRKSRGLFMLTFLTISKFV
jgi:hypothetical protein